MNKLGCQAVNEALRFAVVGVAATAVHYGVYLVLCGFINVSVAYTIGYALSFILNYLLSARFTFKRKVSASNGAGFAAAHAFNYVLQVSLLNLFIWLGVSRQFAPVPVYCIAVPSNFLIVRFVFKHMGKGKQ